MSRERVPLALLAINCKYANLTKFRQGWWICVVS